MKGADAEGERSGGAASFRVQRAAACHKRLKVQARANSANSANVEADRWELGGCTSHTWPRLRARTPPSRQARIARSGSGSAALPQSSQASQASSSSSIRGACQGSRRLRPGRSGAGACSISRRPPRDPPSIFRLQLRRQHHGEGRLGPLYIAGAGAALQEALPHAMRRRQA